jgi:RNA polymerase sigma-70 factor (ECF subfamily)
MIRKSGQGNYAGLCCDAAGDVDLVSAAQTGDQHAFMELCRRYSPWLKRRIWKIVRNREDTEDVLQETLMSAFKHLAGFRAQCSFRTWITTIATNTSLMLLRKRRNHAETGFGLITAEGKEIEILQITDSMPNPEQVYATRQASQRLSQAVKILPLRFRVIVERYHQDELTLVDTANAIGITEAAAKSRLLRARRALRRHLSNDKRRCVPR